MKKLALVLSALALTNVHAEVDTELPIGIEAVTGYRSDYLYKGSKLAGETIDFQLSGEMAYSNTQFLEYSLWHATESGDGDFSESGLAFTYTEQRDQFDYFVGVKYRNLDHDLYQSGFEMRAGARWHHNEFTAISGEISYDTGADGWYSELYWRQLHDLSEDAFVSMRLGLSAVDNYYDRDGLNDAFARVSFTYNISKNVSVTPFVGTSVQFYGDDDTELYGGAWFEVSF